MSLPDYVIKEASLCHKMRKEEVERVPLFLLLVFVKEQTKLFDWIENKGFTQSSQLSRAYKENTTPTSR